MTDIAAEVATPVAVPDPLDSSRLKYVLGVSLAAVLASGVCALFHLGWWSAWIVTLGAFAALAVYAAVKRDSVLVRLLAFGFVAAVGEILGADRWAVQSGTLVYAPHGPFVVDSPGYMLASWTVAATQFSLLGMWLSSKLGNKWGAVACAIVGGTNLPMYESLAWYAKWWTYQHCPMILHAPWYVILGEVGIGLVFPWFGTQVTKRPAAWILPLGVALGVWMFVAGWLAYRVVG